MEVEEPPRRATFQLRMRALVLRWGTLRPHEPVLLELPLGRAPPQGATLTLLGQLREPRGPANGFDEKTWLRHHGVHAVLRADSWRISGHRGGLGGVADRLHAWLARDGVPGLSGERRGVLEGVLLGEDQGLSAGLQQSFRASGLYHLLAVSGGNVAVVVLGTLGLAFALGVPRLAAEVAALAAIGAYVLAVGPQPSVIRAGIAGALGSLAWLTGRQRDAQYALLVAASRPARLGARTTRSIPASSSRSRPCSRSSCSRRESPVDSRAIRCRDGFAGRSPSRRRAGSRRRRSPGSSSTRSRS